MPSRRAFVASLSTLSLAGCYSVGGGYDASEPEPREPVRGRGGTDLEAETREELDVDYRESDDEVKFVKSVSGDCDPEYDPDEPADEDCNFTTTSAESWAEARILTAVGDASVRRVRAQLDVASVESAAVTGEGLEAVEDARVEHGAEVRAVTLVDERDGSIIESPGVPFRELVAATPRTVHGRYRLVDVHGDSFERERDVPVYATHKVVRTNPENNYP